MADDETIQKIINDEENKPNVHAIHQNIATIIKRYQDENIGRFTELETQVTALTGQITTLTGQVTALTARVRALEDQNTTLTNQVAAQEAELEQMLNHVNNVKENAIGNLHTATTKLQEVAGSINSARRSLAGIDPRRGRGRGRRNGNDQRPVLRDRN